MDPGEQGTLENSSETTAGGLPLSFPPVEDQHVAPASLLESSWAGVLDFTNKQITAKQPSGSAASTGMGSDWHVLKLSNDEGSSSSSPRSLPDSLTEESSRGNLSVSAECLEGSDESSGSGLKNEAIADLLLQSTDADFPALRLNETVEAEQATDVPVEALPSGRATAQDCNPAEYAALLDIDSFEAVRAQGTVSSEGSVDGYSEASFPSSPRSPRMRLMEAAELEVEMEVGEELSGMRGILDQVVEALKGTYQQAQDWASDNMGLLLKALRHGAADVIAFMDGCLPPAVHQAVLRLKAAMLQPKFSGWMLIALSVSVAALVVLLVDAKRANSTMAQQLQQKDSELARLVVRIFTLQDTLQNPRHTPVIRHTHLPTAGMHPLF